MLNTLQHPAITRLRAFGYEGNMLDTRCCQMCGRDISFDPVDIFGNPPAVCARCEAEMEEADEEMES